MGDVLVLMRCGHWCSVTRIGGGEPAGFLAPPEGEPIRCPETDELTEVEYRIAVTQKQHGTNDDRG